MSTYPLLLSTLTIALQTFECASSFCSIKKIVSSLKLIVVDEGQYSYLYDFDNNKTEFYFKDILISDVIKDTKNAKIGAILKNGEKFGYYSIIARHTTDFKYEKITCSSSGSKYFCFAVEDDNKDILDGYTGEKLIAIEKGQSFYINGGLLFINNKDITKNKLYDLEKGKYVFTDYDFIYGFDFEGNEPYIIASKNNEIYLLDFDGKVKKEISGEFHEYIKMYGVSRFKIIDKDDDLDTKWTSINSKDRMRDLYKLVRENKFAANLENFNNISNASNEYLIELTALILMHNVNIHDSNSCFNKQYISNKIQELFGVENVFVDKVLYTTDNYYCLVPGVGGGAGSEAISEVEKEYEEGELYVYEILYTYESEQRKIKVKFKKVGDLYKIVSISDDWMEL